MTAPFTRCPNLCPKPAVLTDKRHRWLRGVELGLCRCADGHEVWVVMPGELERAFPARRESVTPGNLTAAVQMDLTQRRRSAKGRAR